MLSTNKSYYIYDILVGDSFGNETEYQFDFHISVCAAPDKTVGFNSPGKTVGFNSPGKTVGFNSQVKQ